MATEWHGHARGVLGAVASRRAVLAAFGTVAAGLLGARRRTGRSGAAARTKAGSRPNIVLILTDDLDARSLEFMPNVAALLGREGTTFANAFVTTPLCCPSRASILRGQYAHNHRVLGNGRESGGFDAFSRFGQDQSTVATWLQAAGYRTALVGKYLNGYAKGAMPYVPPGWDEWFALMEETGKYFNYGVNENGQLVGYGDRPADYSTDVVAARGSAFIRDATSAGQPFFLYLAPNAPHGPATPAPLDAAAYPEIQAPRPLSFDEADVSDKPAWLRDTPPLSESQLAKIDASYGQRLRSLLAVDALVASTIVALGDAGALDNTYVVFTSDNGYHLGEHRIGTAKRSPYEEAIRVPLLVRGPGVAAGKIEDRLALNIDLAPTCAELAGTITPDFVDGRSLVPLFGSEPPESWRQAALIEGSCSSDAGSRARRDLRNTEEERDEGDEPGMLTFTALRSEGRIFVEYSTGERELYDLDEDPFQLDNQAAHADPALLSTLSTRAAAMARCAGGDCRAAQDAVL